MVASREALNIRRKYWKIWSSIDDKLFEKFKNICGKTGMYDVPIELFQKRTHRKNRVLLRWKVLQKNNMTIEHLKTFYGGVCVEFVNDDFFNENNHELDIFKQLVSKIGSDNKISAILSFRNEDGDSGSTSARYYYNKFLEMDKENYSPIKRNPNISYSGMGDNSVWEGNLFYLIKGGSQNSFSSHEGITPPQLFNPAVEYANEVVCTDIDITMSYFAMHCFDFDINLVPNYQKFKSDVENYLKCRIYDEGSLFDYCKNHQSIRFGNGFLIDPIQMRHIGIDCFKTSGLDDSCVLSHSEATNKYRFHFDSIHKCILTPGRPTNLFWSFHLSNMMQQNYNLEEYFEKEIERVNLRHEHM